MVMQRVQNLLQIVLALHEIRPFKESPPFLNNLIKYFGVLSCVIDIIFRMSQLLLQVKFDLLFLISLVVEHGPPRIIRLRYIIALLDFPLLKLLKFIFLLLGVSDHLLPLLYLFVEFFEDVALFLFEILDGFVEGFDFTGFASQVEL